MPKRPIPKPTAKDENQLLDIWDNAPDIILIRERKFAFRWLNGHARLKITNILNRKSRRDDAATHKCVAAAVLNGYFRIKFLYWFLWRWYFYVRQYGEEELEEAVKTIKKKVPDNQYFRNIISLTAIRTTIMQMNSQEVRRSLQELSSDKAGKSAKSSLG